MQTIEEMVHEFHAEFELPVDLDNKEIIGDLIRRHGLIQEEYFEVIEAIEDLEFTIAGGDADDIEDHHAHVLKELCDLVYVAVGTAIAWGYNFTEAFEEVHASNMSKNGDIVSGKMTKGRGYIEADVSAFTDAIHEDKESAYFKGMENLVDGPTAEDDSYRSEEFPGVI